jgi:exodeoxyribonuclease-3
LLDVRIATWNVNSIRARLERVLQYLRSHLIDVLAMQETKVPDADFPQAAFGDLGYEVAFSGLNQWNGVAIASRVGLRDIQTSLPGQPAFGAIGQTPVIEPRVIGATCSGVRVWSVYVPHGRSAQDPHMQYKLSFLNSLANDAASWLANDPSAKIALVGDFNVAPFDTDVWDPEYFAGLTHTSAAERDGLGAIARAGFREVSREHLPGEHLYTNWDYQNLRFPRNQGLRIDFAYCSPALADSVVDVAIVRDERKGKGASDHVPVELTVA